MERAVVFAIVAAGIALVGPTAYAGTILTLDDLGTPGLDVTIADNSALDSDPVVGQIGVPLNPLGFIVGSFIVDPSTFGFVYQGDTETMTDIHLSITSTGDGQFRVGLTSTDFTLPDPNMPWDVIGRVGGVAIGGTGDATITWQHAYDPANAEFGYPSGTTIGTTLTGGPFDSTLSQDVHGSNPFSISQEVTVTARGSDQVISFDSNTDVIQNPEPVSLALWLVTIGAGMVAVRYGRGSWGLPRQLLAFRA